MRRSNRELFFFLFRLYSLMEVGRANLFSYGSRCRQHALQHHVHIKLCCTELIRQFRQSPIRRRRRRA